MWGNVAVTQAYLTLSEVLGHVDLLLERGAVAEVEGDDGVVRFARRARGPPAPTRPPRSPRSSRRPSPSTWPPSGACPAPMDDDHAARIARGEQWVADQDGRLVASVVLLDRGDHLHVENVAVAP